MSDATILSFEEPAAVMADESPRATTTQRALHHIYANDLDAALVLIDQAEAEGAPEFLILSLRGGIHLRRHQWSDALPYFLRARAIDDDNPMTFINIGMISFELGEFATARDYFRASIMRDHGIAKAWLKLAASHIMLQDWPESLACYERAVALDPNDSECHRGLATICSTLGQDEAALHHYRMARDLAGDDPDAESGEGFTLLRMGRWAEGWPRFEARWRLPIRRPEMPEYRGAPLFQGTLEDLRGKTVLLRTEQGWGDSIQFLRFVKPLSAVAGRIIVECGEPLLRLVERIEGVDEVFLRDASAPEFDAQTSLMSLPLLFGTTPKTCPPPLAIPIKRIHDYRPTPSIGICWHGGAREFDPMAHAIDVRRSLTYKQFRPIVDAIDARNMPCFSLQQKHIGQGDWWDTAECIAAHGLVITVDTAVAHLAASMGVPTWILCRFDQCWRWGLGEPVSGHPTVWYPSARVYRQRRLCEWQPVLEKVVADLKVWADGK